MIIQPINLFKKYPIVFKGGKKPLLTQPIKPESKGGNMKKLVTIMAVIALCGSAVFAEETNQTINNQNSYLGINFEKKPVQDTGKQTIKNERSFLFINFVINGKPLECKADNK